MKLKIVILIWLVSILIGSCDSDDPIIDCTAEFVILTISVQDNVGNPIVFDSVAVNRESDNFLYVFDVEIAFEPGTYILMTDKYFQDMSSVGTTVLFAGYNDPISLQLVASYEYVVKKGICHVEKVSGNDVIITP
jgi:hypothetical protein